MNSDVALILATSLNDAQMAAQILSDAGLRATACSTPHDFFQRLEQGCGVLVISEESLDAISIQNLEAALLRQPTWSDLPMILLTTHERVKLSDRFSVSANLSLLERPFSKQTFVRAVTVALRARKKQYQVAALLTELTKAKEEAERANLTKTQFLANMSHEIRTPIGAVIGFSDLIRQPNLASAERARYTEIINRNSHQLLRLIDDILDLSKVEAGKLSIEAVEFRLPDVLADLASLMKFRAGEKGIGFKIGFDSAIPELISSDPVRLRQILSNLVGNAIKFTESGLVELRVESIGAELRFTVRDSGIGLTALQSANLFKPFTQADSTTTRKFGGTGLGLTIAKHLANVMGGDVVLQSTAPETGTEFLVTIKVRLSENTRKVGLDALTIRSSDEKPVELPKSLEGLKVLLVEDSPDNQMLITRYLKKAGCLVTIANDGVEGFEKASTPGFDVILMDIQMPKMDGHETTRKLRSAGVKTPIVALTAHAMQEEKRKGMESGFTEFLTKPVQPVVLINLLSDLRDSV